jgi:hypothetical protein
MNIYLLERTDKLGYDDFDSAVVAAENEENAKSIQIGYTYNNISRSWTTPNNIKSTLIGIAAPFTKSGIILASYNGG